MPKLLFVTPSFKNGGTVSCLKSLLPFLKKEGFEVDLFALTPEGPNYDDLSRCCNVLSAPMIGNGNRKGSALLRVAKRVKHSLASWGVDISNMVYVPMVKKLEKKQYDWVVAFQEESVTKFVSSFNTNNLIAWVHCDYTRVIKKNRLSKDIKTYKRYKSIVFVSDYTRSRFVNIFPQFSDKTIAIHNFVAREKIREYSLSSFNNPQVNRDENYFISIGRIDPVKQFSVIPSIARQLKEKGLKYKWYIVGGGDNVQEIQRIKEEIQKEDVQDTVIMLGNLDNPFPLLKRAKLLVCTSLSEAYPNVVQEAIALEVPSVITDFGSSKEVVKNGYNGFICPISSVGDKIYELMNNDEMYQSIKNNTGNTLSENNLIAEQLLSLFQKD